jgi:hypothetical protein
MDLVSAKKNQISSILVGFGKDDFPRNVGIFSSFLKCRKFQFQSDFVVNFKLCFSLFVRDLTKNF